MEWENYSTDIDQKENNFHVDYNIIMKRNKSPFTGTAAFNLYASYTRSASFLFNGEGSLLMVTDIDFTDVRHGNIVVRRAQTRHRMQHMSELFRYASYSCIVQNLNIVSE